MKALNAVILTLVIIGGINWGLIGLFNYNLVDSIFGTMSLISRVIYTLVGVAAIWAIAFFGYGKAIQRG